MVFIWNPLKNAATLAHSHRLWIFLDKQLLQQFTQRNQSQKKMNRIKHKEKLLTASAAIYSITASLIQQRKRLICENISNGICTVQVASD